MSHSHQTHISRPWSRWRVRFSSKSDDVTVTPLLLRRLFVLTGENCVHEAVVTPSCFSTRENTRSHVEIISSPFVSRTPFERPARLFSCSTCFPPPPLTTPDPPTVFKDVLILKSVSVVFVSGDCDRAHSQHAFLNRRSLSSVRWCVSQTTEVAAMQSWARWGCGVWGGGAWQVTDDWVSPHNHTCGYISPGTNFHLQAWQMQSWAMSSQGSIALSYTTILRYPLLTLSFSPHNKLSAAKLTGWKKV